MGWGIDLTTIMQPVMKQTKSKQKSQINKTKKVPKHPHVQRQELTTTESCYNIIPKMSTYEGKHVSITYKLGRRGGQVGK